jgi:hypothetical protein
MDTDTAVAYTLTRLDAFLANADSPSGLLS